jgi:hypothetical protein
MAGRDKKARQLRSLRALFEDARGGRSSARLPIQALLGAALRAAAGLSGLTRCKPVFCRSQPTGGSCVGNDGETQLRRALNKAPVSCRTSQEANVVMLSLAPDVELGWTKFSASLPLQGNRA